MTFLQNGCLWTTYTVWLQLMVAQFDAVKIFVQYIQKLQCNTVSVNILVPPMTNETLLPWQEVFSGCYLPNMHSRNNAWDIPSQYVICDFLEEGISRAGAMKEELGLAKIACTKWPTVNHPHHSPAKVTLEKFCQDSNIQLQVHAILTKISEWQSISQLNKNKNRVPLSRDISSMIKQLKTDLQKQCYSDRFLLKLETMLVTGIIHCEACLASLPPSFTEHFQSDGNKYKDSWFSFFFLFIWLRAGYWSVKTLLPMLWGISQHLDKRALRKCCHPRQPWQDFPLSSTAMDFKQHCGHDEHNVWRAVAARSCGPEKVKEWSGF